MAFRGMRAGTALVCPDIPDLLAREMDKEAAFLGWIDRQTGPEYWTGHPSPALWSCSYCAGLNRQEFVRCEHCGAARTL